MSSLSPWLIAGLTAAALLGFSGGALLFRVPDLPSIQPADELRVHLAVYGGDGTILYSTKEAHRSALENAKAKGDGPFVLPEKFGPVTLLPGNGTEPLSLLGGKLPLGSELFGKSVGFTTFVPLLGRVPDYTEPLRLDRIRGPFNLTMLVDEDELENLTTNEHGGAVRIDDLLTANVIERANGVARIRFDLADGQLLEVRRAGFMAEVGLSAASETFDLYLHTSPEHLFTLTQSCRVAKYVLPTGSYVVTEVNETSISLLRSPTKLPQLIGQELGVMIEVVEIVGRARSGGES